MKNNAYVYSIVQIFVLLLVIDKLRGNTFSIHAHNHMLFVYSFSLNLAPRNKHYVNGTRHGCNIPVRVMWFLSIAYDPGMQFDIFPNE